MDDGLRSAGRAEARIGYSRVFPAAFAAFQRAFAAAAILPLAAADNLRFPGRLPLFPFTLAQRAFCAALMAARPAADSPLFRGPGAELPAPVVPSSLSSFPVRDSIFCLIFAALWRSSDERCDSAVDMREPA